MQQVHGTLPLDTFARCHFTQELYRMTWGWEPRCSYEVDPDDENPFPLYGNWATPEGNFFCERYDGCPPCEDSIRGPRKSVTTKNDPTSDSSRSAAPNNGTPHYSITPHNQPA